MLEYEVTLPKGVTCEQCVIQWTWKSGNDFMPISMKKEI